MSVTTTTRPHSKPTAVAKSIQTLPNSARRPFWPAVCASGLRPYRGALKEGLSMTPGRPPARRRSARVNATPASPLNLRQEASRGLMTGSRPGDGRLPRRRRPAILAGLTVQVSCMSLFRLYARVLGQLGSDLRLGAVLALANVALAIAAFAEPILFGRIIDRLTQGQAAGGSPVTFASLMPLILAWVGFGLFTIGAGVTVALHADRLSHRRRLATMANYFEHVLELPLAFHTATHSGRVLKVMLEGSNGMAWLWLGFFRDHLAALIALLVLLPLTVFLNWRLGLLLVLLVFVFAILTAIVMRKTETLQGTVESFHSSLAEQASDALGNVPVIQSFTRAKAEATALHGIIHQLLQAQNPVLSWWALASVATRASATITVTSIVLVGTGLHLRGLATIGEIVTFMSIATMLIGRLEQAVQFINQLFMQAPKMREFFDILDTT